MSTEHKPLFSYLRDFARTTPEKPAIIYYGFTITYRELNDLSDRFAAYLLKKGITKGDRIALFMQNCPQYLICSYGAQKIGAIVGPCSPMFKEWELEYELNDLGARVIVTLDHLYPIVDQIRSKTSLEHIVVTNYLDFLPEQPYPDFPEPIVEKRLIPETDDLLHLLDTNSASLPEIDIDVEQDVSLIVYTSGSTGLPKGAMLTYRNAQFKSDCVTRAYGYHSNDVHLCVMPIFHIAGLLFSANVTIYTGATMVMLTRYNPTAFLQVVNKYRITSAYTTVPMNVEVMNHPLAKETNFDSFRINPCTSFGIALNEEIATRWMKLTGSQLFEMSYGLSETHTGDTFMPLDKIKYGSMGVPTYDTQIRIVSFENPDVEMPIGEQGEIAVKSAGVFKGYWNKPDATSDTLRDGWVYTGDMGRLDEDGYLYFSGRKKEMIKCSGYSVFPEEVEQFLGRHPGILAVAVIGVPDPVRGESVKAFVVLNRDYKEKLTPEEIISWSRDNMANYKYPRYVEIREALPATGTGKVLRRLLKDEEQKKTATN